MAEGAQMMYHGSGGFGGAGQVAGAGGAERAPRHYPLEVLQVMGARDKQHKPSAAGDCAFGYESDDSSLSSNASGNKEEKGEPAVSERPSSGGHGAREWRRNSKRADGRPPRRILPDRYLCPSERYLCPPDRYLCSPERYLSPPDRYLSASYPFQVKFTPDDLLNGSEYDALSQEMWDRFVKSQQTEETFRKKMNLWRYLYVTIKSIFPRYGLYVVGSTMSGFGLDSSDMDLCLFVRPTDSMEPRAHALLHLNYILGYIKTIDPGASLIQAKVPILKFRDARNGLQVDLNCNNIVGVRNTDLLNCFSKLDWRVRPLVALTKLWAQAHNINDARHCTLSSYSLTLMVIHFLQCGTSPAILPRAVELGWEWRRAHNRCSLAELFINLLHYYAHFPYSRMAVSVRLGARIPIAECRAARAVKNDPHQWKLVCVEEPFDLTNTARSVYDPDTFERIVAAFRASAARLAAARTLQAAWPDPPAR